MTKPITYIWASWNIPMGMNLAPYLMSESDETVYIHAFTEEDDEDGEGYHINTEGTLIHLEHEKDGHGDTVRLVIAIPAGDWVQYKDAVFSPAMLGTIEADAWGMGTDEEISIELEGN